MVTRSFHDVSTGPFFPPAEEELFFFTFPTPTFPDPAEPPPPALPPLLLFTVDSSSAPAADMTTDGRKGLLLTQQQKN
jgi:hypothetical protein